MFRHRLPSVIPAALASAALLLGGCASRSRDIAPTPANPADFIAWSCDHIADEVTRVQQRASDVAYAVDERAGNNILALGLGVTVFWPAILAMRPDGLEAAELSRLKGRFEALQQAAANKRCPPPGEDMSPSRQAALPLTVGERLVYEDRANPRRPPVAWELRVAATRRAEIEFQVLTPPGGRWVQDLAGNITAAPDGVLQWQRLLRGELELGQVVSGELTLGGDGSQRARLRGQVVALGPQTVAGRRFDVAVIELFGDAPRGEGYTRVEGALVADRASGILLRLDLRSANTAFELQRRLMRIEPAFATQ